MTNIIQVDNLVYDYPGKRALKDVTFALPEHSITALVGPNGAGKTTLMRCLAALDRPLHGEIILDGIDVQSQPLACHQRVGYLSDFFGLYSDLTVRQCLQFVAESHKIAQPLQAVDKTIESLKLEPYADKLAATLSRGWQQRLGIAQAIIHKPKMLLLDEPASGLDPVARSELATLLVSLLAEGVSIMVSSHILSELKEYSTHMLVLEGGVIQDFRAIRQHDKLSAAKRIKINLVTNTNNIEQELMQFDHVKLLCISETEIELEFTGDDASQAELLKSLVSAGLPICAFSIVEQDMQDVYLEIINQQSANEIKL